jgi:hypothetical protein
MNVHRIRALQNEPASNHPPTTGIEMALKLEWPERLQHLAVHMKPTTCFSEKRFFKPNLLRMGIGLQIAALLKTGKC